ncbi:rhomboid family intramembrane serine protease [Flavobacteriaceae bacterium S0825]|uniref:rhomboid family intramembrane serine protease n=1 Tax=Gaetbulibacter sp. S0825 TaxID=2720084 RepID=UPI001430BE8D|nr:rhomboid family intramembrane serine protease [Gaetbulibacter sp. S0825]MCK0108771.1 rhomboid family intramembrane serine protease [Flavobacteriaceae bacterium S0825]NIX64407.1 rhomboid family intramembrane serine protease [Gaetbulibacter sp. S0825]
MNNQDQFKYTTGVIGFPLAFVIILWLIFWFEVRFGFSFNDLGVYPRTLSGLKGVVFSPFVHGSMEHLYHNSIPLFVLSMALFYFYREISWKVIGYGILLSGLLTWFIARPSYHIGASGLIYVLMSFILFKGIFAKHFRLIALSLLVVFLYGSMIWYVFPIKEKVSWEGHLSGLIIGFVFALFFRKSIAKPKKYAWEQPNYNEDDDPFLKHFDENGNFIETLPEESEIVEEHKPRLKITYHIRRSSKD